MSLIDDSEKYVVVCGNCNSFQGMLLDIIESSARRYLWGDYEQDFSQECSICGATTDYNVSYLPGEDENSLFVRTESVTVSPEGCTFHEYVDKKDSIVPGACKCRKCGTLALRRTILEFKAMGEIVDRIKVNGVME